jgi:filamentous hemagglutinin family protein
MRGLLTGTRLGLILGLLSGSTVYANPEGANIVRGQVNFNHPDPSTLNISNSNGAIINWQDFSIQQNEITRFIQNSANSAVLNRVTSQNPSSILGQLLSNGRVFVMNPNGIVFGKDNVASLLKLCRQEGIEVIHLRARFNLDKSGWMPIYKLGRRMPCVDGTSGVELLEEAREIPGELVIEKQCFDGKQKVIHVSSVTSNYLSLTGINSVVRIGVLGKFFLITVTFLWVCRQVFDELPLHTVMVQ